MSRSGVRFSEAAPPFTWENSLKRMGEAQSRELDKTYAKQLKNVGDVEFMDSGDRAPTAW